MLLALVPAAVPAAENIQALEWLDLMPPSDRAALEELAEIDHTSGTGFDANAADTPEVLTSRKTVAELHGKTVRIPGFVVPVEYDDDLRITTFFLVPYFGACIHVPPPPPNQIVYVRYPEGFTTEMLVTPFQVTGRLSVESVDLDLAGSAYTLSADSIDPYTE